MYLCRHREQSRGYSLIELILVIAIVLMVFTAIIGMFRAGVDLLALNKARGTALTLAGDQLEFIRSLSYNAVGTVGGIPAGSIPQLETIEMNGHTYVRRTFIQYYDDPAYVPEENGIETVSVDYKKAKVEVLWDIGHGTSSVSLVTNVVPRGIGGLAGGTLRITAINALGMPVPTARVQVTNPTLDPAIDVVAYTNAAGQLILPGAPEGSDYAIEVSRAGYSTDQTYEVTPQNPNPSPGPISVAEGFSSSMTFAIDTLAQMTVRTRSPRSPGEYVDPFATGDGVVNVDQVVVSDEALLLAESAGVFETEGSARSVLVAPPSLAQWAVVSAEDARPPDTAVRYRVLFDTGSGIEAIPETALPGNSAGFATTPIDLSGLDVSTYSALSLEAVLETSNTATSSRVHRWALSYFQTDLPIGSVPFFMIGAKSIGEQGGSPVLKYAEDHTTNALGEVLLPSLEWDAYTITVPASSGLAVAEICPPQPMGIAPGENALTEIGLVSVAPNSLRVIVRDTSNALVDHASVRLTRTGYDQTRSTSCGQAFFTPLSAGDTYTVEATRASVGSVTEVDVSVDGDTVISVTLAP